jgi:hypothetical protein
MMCQPTCQRDEPTSEYAEKLRTKYGITEPMAPASREELMQELADLGQEIDRDEA